MRTLVCLIAAALLMGCATAPATFVSSTFVLPTPAPQPPPATSLPGLDAPIADGLRFLKGQYNPEYGLLQESPNIGRHRYYLTNDNALAAYVFEKFGEDEMASILRSSLDRYGYDSNGFVEVAWGEAIVWPPLHHKDIVVEKKVPGACDLPNTEETGPLADCVLQETHTPDLGFFYDWSSFSNLHCMGAVNEYNKGNLAVAHWLYATELSTFDGVGWADEAWRRRDGVYETIGPAWCLYAGALLGLPVHEDLLVALLAQQNKDTGGFHTHYRRDAFQLTDPNVETTSLALLALYTLQHPAPTR
jgi:hypothetical protein